MSALTSLSEPNFDLLRIKSKYGLRCSTEEEPSEAEMSIAYQPLRNSLEDDSDAAFDKSETNNWREDALILEIIKNRCG